jgi:hypothetical protein
VVDSATGDVLVEGTPVNEVNLNRVESGLMVALYDVGAGLLVALQEANANRKELEKIKNQRVLQGQATITNSTAASYFRDSEPFVLVSLTGYPQINAPDYDVLVTPISASDMGTVGNLDVYDKTQNGFKVKMTGSAASVTFMWTLVNPRV